MANSANALNIKSAGIPVFDGTATFTESTTTQYNVLVGNTSNAIANVAPSATSGIPLISQGNAANPSFGTAVVAGGGTGAATLTGVLTGNGTSAITANTVTQHGVLLGGATNAVSSLGVGTTGQVLTGVTGADPSWQSPAASSISITGNSGGALVGAAFTFTGGTTGLTFAGAGSTETLGGTLVVSNGGTGVGTLTGVLTGNGTSAITANAVTQHGVLIGGATNAVSSLGVAATGSTLMGATGADPAFTGSPSFSGSVTAGTTITASSGAITATSGDVVITSGNLTLPTTTSSVGQIKINGTRVFHTYGTANTVLGSGSMNFTTTSTNNVFIGDVVAPSLGATANSNVGVGSEMFNNLTTGNSNVGIGFNTLYSITTGIGNACVGYASFNNMGTSGSYNAGLGYEAGSSATGTSSSNIYLNSAGAAESNTLRIGSATGTGNQQLNVAVICGINGSTSASGTAVLVNSSNVLGTTTSSLRFKDNIQDMGSQSSDIFKLRPVTFNYKVSKPHVSEEDATLRQFGLIAEEVEQVMPDQVNYNLDGQIESVRYLNLIPMLLNEIQKLRKELDELKRSM